MRFLRAPEMAAKGVTVAARECQDRPKKAKMSFDDFSETTGVEL
jgi:hypothetical protein